MSTEQGTSLRLPTVYQGVINECDPLGHEKKTPLLYACLHPPCWFWLMAPPWSERPEEADALTSTFGEVPPFFSFLLVHPICSLHNYLAFPTEHGVCSQSNSDLIFVKFIKHCLNFSILRQMPDEMTTPSLNMLKAWPCHHTGKVGPFLASCRSRE